MSEGWLTMGNIIKLSEISVTNIRYEFPLDGEYLNELEYEGSYVSY